MVIALCPAAECQLLGVASRGGKGVAELFGVLFIRPLILFMKAPPKGANYLSRPYFHIPPHWRLGLQQMNLGAAAAAKSLQLCPTLCDPIDGSPPGSPVPGILQARTLEWVAISFSNA